MDIWKKSSIAKKSAIIIGIVVIVFLLCKWIGWI
jgi:hypothetical protein